MASGLMSLFAERMKHQVIDEVLREIGLLPQLYEHFLASDDKTVVSLPWRNYCRALSQPLFSYVSDFYGAFLRHSPSERNCSVCLSQHSRNQLSVRFVPERRARFTFRYAGTQTILPVRRRRPSVTNKNLWLSAHQL